MFGALKGIQELCYKNNAKFFLIILPSREALYPNRFQKESIRLINLAENKARALGIQYISLRKELEEKGGKKLYIDFCHPTAEGYSVIAEELNAYFLKKLKNE